MKNQAVNEKGHFLNEKQKLIKQKIMENLMDGLFNPFITNKESFPDLQSISDLIFSILVMFNRDVLVHTLVNLGLTNERKIIIENLFDEISKQVSERIKLQKN